MNGANHYTYKASNTRDPNEWPGPEWPPGACIADMDDDTRKRVRAWQVEYIRALPPSAGRTLMIAGLDIDGILAPHKDFSYYAVSVERESERARAFQKRMEDWLAQQ